MSQEKLTPKAEQKQQNILRIALKVFAKEGFRNTDVQVIADLAKVGKGTVYRHFGNKEQLFLATARHALKQLGDYVEQQLGGEEAVPQLVQEIGTVEVLRRIALACAEHYQKCPQAVEIMIQERAEFRDSVYPSHLMFRTETRHGFEEMLRGAINSGELRELDVVAATNAYADLLFGTVVTGCLEGGRGELVRRVEKAMDLLIYGLVASVRPANDSKSSKA